MKHVVIGAASAAFLALPAMAQGELNIFNWGNYTNPEAIKKFEAETGIKVTVTDYDSNDTALAKVEAGGHGFDLIGPSSNYVTVFAEKGIIAELDHSKLPSIGNIDENWVDVDWDPGRKYSLPYLWGTTSFAINTSVYTGNINDSDLIFDPPPELEGKLNMLPEMSDVMSLAVFNQGGEYCTEDLEVLKRVRDMLVKAKPKWISMEYSAIEPLANGNVAGSVTWNGAAMRARLANPDIAYAYPKQGYTVFMDNLSLLSDARNVENAYRFLEFTLQPENAALFSEFAKYNNGIKGSAEFLPEDMRNAPEIHIPQEALAAGRFIPACEGKGFEYMSAIWTELQK